MASDARIHPALRNVRVFDVHADIADGAIADAYDKAAALAADCSEKN